MPRNNALYRFVLFFLVTVGINQSIAISQDEMFTPSWNSLARHEAAPEWFVDAKLGIYFHWGVYSVPAYGTAWYPRNMFLKNSDVFRHHEATYGNNTEFGYEDFIPRFKAEHFDPEAWATLFQEAGARFAGPVAQHHDGFAMWDSQVNPWNAKSMGPERDIMGEIFKALRQRNLKTIATFHHARHGQRNANNPENWKNGYNSHYPYHPDWPTATTDPKLRMLYGNFPTIEDFHNYWLNQVDEVSEKYSPDIIWFDSWLNLIPESYRQRMAANFLNQALNNQREVVMCHKHTDMPETLSVLDFEQGGRRDIHPLPWMTDITLGQTRWAYIEGHPVKDIALVLRNMIDVWSKNGIVLLNVSPRADGVIPEEQQGVLRELGEWLNTHGEAVYNTRPFTTFGYGPTQAKPGSHGGQSATVDYTAADIRFTLAKDGKALYLFFLGAPPRGKKIQLRPLGIHRYHTPSPIKRITLLGQNVEAAWELKNSELYLTVPDVPLNELATVFKFELE
ncbi:MAG: alpha-L-fucosidase [Bacteroidota bacterium]